MGLTSEEMAGRGWRTPCTPKTASASSPSGTAPSNHATLLRDARFIVSCTRTATFVGRDARSCRSPAARHGVASWACWRTSPTGCATSRSARTCWRAPRRAPSDRQAEAARADVAEHPIRASRTRSSRLDRGRYTYAHGALRSCSARAVPRRTAPEMHPQRRRRTRSRRFIQAGAESARVDRRNAVRRASRARCSGGRIPSPTGVSRGVLRRHLGPRARRAGAMDSDREYLRPARGGSCVGTIFGSSSGLDGAAERVAMVRRPRRRLDGPHPGETGTGKELVARAIHDAPRGATGRWSRSNCARAPDGPGRERAVRPRAAARSPARPRRTGRFELAHGGTLFLDEIGELPLETQAEAAARAAGTRVRARRRRADDPRRRARDRGDEPRPRVRRVARGAFREDLLLPAQRVSRCTLPPLRERDGRHPRCSRTSSSSGSRARRARSPASPDAAMARLSRYHVAGQRARAAERHRARRHLRARGGGRPRGAARAGSGCVAPAGRLERDAEPPDSGRSPRSSAGTSSRCWPRPLGHRRRARRGPPAGAAPNTLRSRLKRWGVNRPQNAN